MKHKKSIVQKAKREISIFLSKIGLRKVHTNYLGKDIVVPMIDGTGRQLIVPDELWMSRCLRRFLEWKKGTVFDIGANVGLYLVKLKAIDETRPYIGFEPNPFCYYYLNELIRINKFDNCYSLPVALSDNEGIQNVYASKKDDGGASLVHEYKQDENLNFTAKTLVFKGDDIVKKISIDSGISAIKIDVEGLEFEVLSGLKNTLSTYHPAVYCEILPLPDKHDRSYPSRRERLGKLFTFLKSINYKMYGAFADASLGEVKNPENVCPPFGPDFILVHQTDERELLEIFLEEKGNPIPGR